MQQYSKKYQKLLQIYKDKGFDYDDSLNIYPYDIITQIVRYVPKYPNTFFNFWEILKKYNQLFKFNGDTINIQSKNESFNDCCKFYNIKYLYKYLSFNKSTHYDLKYTQNIDDIDNSINVLLCLNSSIPKIENEIINIFNKFQECHLYCPQINNIYLPNYYLICINNKKHKNNNTKEIINNFAINYYKNKIINLQQIMDNIKLSDNDKINKCMMWSKKYDLQILPFDKKPFQSELGKKIIDYQFKYYQPLKIQLYKNDDSKQIPLPKKLFKKLNQNIDIFTAYMDNIPMKYHYIKFKVRYYMPPKSTHKTDIRLTTILKNKFNTGTISQAWLKIYEIFNTFHKQLINNNSKEYKLFSLCEAPGNFIAGINHFIKTNTNIQSFNWNAQSLKPDGKIGFGDNYGYIEKYKNKWHYGPDNDGDIMNINNIHFYANCASNVNLITSDCGLPEFNDWTYYLIKLHIFEISIILLANNKNSSFIIKLFQKTCNQPFTISLIYLLYKQYDKIYFYKPIINPQSSEFYLVGINRHTLLTNTDKNKLIKILTNYKLFETQNKSFKKFNQSFIKQLYNTMTEIYNHFHFTNIRNLYYYTNIDIIPRKHIDELKEKIIRKNNQWIKKHQVKPISNQDKL